MLPKCCVNRHAGAGRRQTSQEMVRVADQHSAEPYRPGGRGRRRRGRWVPSVVGTKAERQAARKAVSDYHEAQLGELIEHVAMAIDRYRTGEVDAYTVDETIHHYHRAARELWKFCWSGGGTHLEMIAAILDQRTTDGEAYQLVGARLTTTTALNP